MDYDEDDPKLCVNCRALPVRKRRRCSPCAAYFLRTGEDRSPEMVIRHGQNWHDKDAAIKADPALLLTTHEGRQRLRRAMEKRAG